MEAWVTVSHRLARIFDKDSDALKGCVLTIQKLARFEHRIDEMEEAYQSKRSQNIQEVPGELDDIDTYTYLWILGAYEIIRTLAQKTGDEALKTTRDQFNRIRVPMAKLEASSKYKNTDWAFPQPVFSPGSFRTGWALNQEVIVTRAELSDALLSSLKRFCQIDG